MQILSKKIAVFTGSRAEYGLLYWTMRGIREHPSLDLQLIVSGMHLSSEFGNTVNEISQDGFQIDEKVEILLSSTSRVGVAKSIGVGVISFADTLIRLNPDCLVILGDRFEALAIAQTAAVLGIPIAHIHGGELTEGLVDDAIRHSITKMAHLHFTSAEEYRKRVIQMGEDPSRVFNVGSPGVENIRRTKLLTRPQLEETLSFELGENPLLVTFHPVTLQRDGGLLELKNLLLALEELLPSHRVIFTHPNADAQGLFLASQIEAFVGSHPKETLLVKSLGQLRYLSLMNLACAVVGNSSSGLIEAPALGVPTINIGSRQSGRLRSKSVVDVSGSVSSIRSALSEAIAEPSRKAARATENTLGAGTTAAQIVKVLESADFSMILQKRFFDLETG